MKKNYIWYALGAIAIFYVLKKKKVIGESFEDAAKQITENDASKLNFKIDYTTFADMYKKSEKS
jgi:hypothetical protein